MKRRMVYPDVLRALSCIAVVFLSVSMACGSIGLSGLLTWAVPMFVMLSGMFFLDSNWYITLRDMMQKYGLRLLIAYLLWGVIGTGVNIATHGVLNGMFSGTGLYLNFLFIMIILYTASPVLRVFTRSAQSHELQYAVLFGLLVGSIYPFIRMHLTAGSIADFAFMGFGYLGVFLTGWFLRSAMFTRQQTRLIYLIGGICLIFSMRGIWFDKTAFEKDPAMMILSPDAIFIAMALFLVVKNTLAGRRLSRNVLQPISKLAQLSFGIYLIHPIILALVCYGFNRAGIMLPPVIFIPVVSILLLAVSAGLTFLIRKIPKVGNYLV